MDLPTTNKTTFSSQIKRLLRNHPKQNQAIQRDEKRVEARGDKSPKAKIDKILI